MTRKERALVIEAAAIVVSGFLLTIVVPGMVNTHDTMVTFAGFALLGLSVAWGIYFIYRLSEELSK